MSVSTPSRSRGPLRALAPHGPPLGRDVGLLVLRLVLGVVLVAHGAQKTFGAFGGSGLSGSAGSVESLGLQPAGLFGTYLALAELVGGLLILIGLLTWLAALANAANLAVATVFVNAENGFFGGFELTLVLSAALLALAVSGAGRFSVDALLAGGGGESPAIE